MKTKDFHIISAFPNILDSYFSDSILKRAQKSKLIKIINHDIRKFTKDRHRNIDDTPYGGGVGMVMMVEPIYLTWKSIRKKKKSLTILLTPTGKVFNQPQAKELTNYDQIIFICGRYEGIDARVEKFVDLKLSIGDYVLTGGELGAAIVVDAVSRLIPGVLGKFESTEDESHSKKGVLEYPHYTRPEIYKIGKDKLSVPPVLLSGNHAKIKEWRENNR